MGESDFDVSPAPYLYVDKWGHYFKDSTWYRGKPLISCCPACKAISERDEARKQSADTNSLMQDDLAALLRALGMSDHARPQSPHEVMQEAIREAEKLREAITRWRTIATYMHVLPVHPRIEEEAIAVQYAFSAFEAANAGYDQRADWIIDRMKERDEGFSNG